jgi:hypothetical protein
MKVAARVVHFAGSEGNQIAATVGTVGVKMIIVGCPFQKE